MKSIRIIIGGVAAIGLLAQAPPAAKRTGPGVQSGSDEKEPELLKTCKVPPPARGGGGARGPVQGRGPAPEAGEKDYTITEIPGVIAGGQKWKEVWQVSGNNADGIMGTKDGGLLIAQNDNSNIVKLDKKGKVTVAYSGLNTSGAVSMNVKGTLFVNNRGLNSSIDILAPAKMPFASKINGDPFDCAGTVLNDLTADKKGGVYFSMGGLYYADPKGVVTKYGDNLRTNGIILSRDEKTLYVTNGATLAAFDVQEDGSLKNQREFAKLEGGGDGSTIDSEGRIYVTTSKPGVQVIDKDGKVLGFIPTPRDVITAAFSGKDKKTLYIVTRDGPKNQDWILAIPMISQGFKGRAK